MAKWPITNGSTVNGPNDGGNRFYKFGGDEDSTTEVNVQQEVRDTYTASNLRFYVTTNAGTTAVGLLRTNGADDTQTVTLNGTGEFEDTSNTDDLTSGDLINPEIDDPDGMHGDTVRTSAIQMTLDASSDVPVLLQGTDWATAGATNFAAIPGAIISATETDVEWTMRASRTVRDLRVYASAHTTNGAITVRKNQTNSSATVTVTGTGEFLDTSNTESYVAGDEITLGSDGTVDTSLEVVSLEANTPSSVLFFGGDAVGASAAYLHPSSLVETATEVEAQVEAAAAATIQNMVVNCTVHAETRTVASRKNAAAGNLTVSVTGTGLFEDTSNSDSLVATNDLSIEQAAGSSGTNSYGVWVEWDGTQVAGATTRRYTLTTLGVG